MATAEAVRSGEVGEAIERSQVSQFYIVVHDFICLMKIVSICIAFNLNFDLNLI